MDSRFQGNDVKEELQFLFNLQNLGTPHSTMEYELKIRAFIDVTTKNKAERFSDRLFSDLSPIVNGKSWSDEKLWEVTCHTVLRYKNNHEALYETMKYFYKIEQEWLVKGPQEEGNEVLVSGVFSTESDQLLKWCNYKLLRHQS